MASKDWTLEEIGELTRGYQAACILIAAAEWDLFSQMSGPPFTAAQAAAKLGADLRALTILLDALVALRLLNKDAQHYDIPASLADILSSGGSQSILAMTQHQAACLRRWAGLGEVVKTGRPAPRQAGLRGAQAEYASFVEAMDNVGRSMAAGVVAALQPLKFRHLLDVGGASGTYTIAFLQANPTAQATLFDLPQVLPQAAQRLKKAGLIDRVKLVAGDFYLDRLPQGADLAWVSAIIHQNSRQQNRNLFALVFAALVSGGRILVRDFLMESTRTAPAGGALFAINMLVATEKGGTYTFDEVRDDLAAAGFTDIAAPRRDDTMYSVMAGRKP